MARIFATVAVGRLAQLESTAMNATDEYQRERLADLAERAESLASLVVSFDPEGLLGEHITLLQAATDLWHQIEQARYTLKWESYTPHVYSGDIYRLRTCCRRCFLALKILSTPDGDYWLSEQMNELACSRRSDRELAEAGYRLQPAGGFPEAFTDELRQLVRNLRQWSERLTVNPAANVVVLDGRSYVVHEDLVRFFDDLRRSGSASLRKYNCNARRLFRELPEALKSIVDKPPGKACRLKL